MFRLISILLSSWVSLALAQLHPGVNLGCRDGFVAYVESCYKFFTVQASWPEAMVFCKAFGGQLAEITSDNEQTFVHNYMMNISSHVSVSFDVWLGASDLLVEGEWEWASSKERLTYTKWKPGEPNNNSGNDHEDCLALLQGDNFVWNDAPCTLRMNFLCEAPMDTVPMGQTKPYRCGCVCAKRAKDPETSAEDKGHEVKPTAKAMTVTTQPSPDDGKDLSDSSNRLPHQSARQLICVVSESSSLQSNDYAKPLPPQKQAPAAEVRREPQRAERSPVAANTTVLTSCLSACFGYPVTGAGKRYRTSSMSRPGRMDGQESDPILRKPIVRRQPSKCFINILRCWCVPGLDPDSSDEEDDDYTAKAPFSTSSYPSLPSRKSSSHRTSELAVP